ncbi:hypothetical protein GLX30_30365 [Streptomyces sp. Tu 2975]|uniref:DUF6221 family protein n=1 Tax=Streptomyces sp. Tu 2975 TaxID=2676871 RepID=UPI00135CB8DB|nr:DUF6221 family protein [Streptomyces sp. Tu 2975]QIP87619.1 hypothetical protein GLX30_30365 [Streptomyces sp. Tu 2975]
MSDDLVAFLRARLDEDEAIARGTARPLNWHQGPGDDDPEWVSDEMVLMWPPEFHTPYEQDKHWRGLTADPAGLAAHIARHDPARVLVEVEAKRRILDEHQEGTLGCAVCAAPEDFDEDSEGNAEWSRAAKWWPCPTLRLLALPYAYHPEYREEWRP